MYGYPEVGNVTVTFTIPNPDSPDEPPLYEGSGDINAISQHVVAGDYDGTVELTIISTGDVLGPYDVTFHVTTDGLVDVEQV